MAQIADMLIGQRKTIAMMIWLDTKLHLAGSAQSLLTHVRRSKANAITFRRFRNIPLPAGPSDRPALFEKEAITDQDSRRRYRRDRG